MNVFYSLVGPICSMRVSSDRDVSRGQHVGNKSCMSCLWNLENGMTNGQRYRSFMDTLGLFLLKGPVLETNVFAT